MVRGNEGRFASRDRRNGLPLISGKHGACLFLTSDEPISQLSRKIVGSQYHGSIGLGFLFEELREARSSITSRSRMKPLQQGEVRGYDFNRSVVEFTMLNQGNVILCARHSAGFPFLQKLAINASALLI
jgi:hypothetical protein